MVLMDEEARLDVGARLVKRHREALQASRAMSSYPPTGEPATPAPAAAIRPTEAILNAPPPSDDEVRAAIKADFKVFLALVWRHLGLPAPTPIQLSMADYLQYGPRSSVIMAFRGAAKSWITAAFALWTLYCNPQSKVMVVSGSMKRAVAFTTFCLALIRDMPLLQFLAPRHDQRQSATLFDVGPARPDQSASLFAAGITGQIVGFRADLIVGDDVETNTNSLTVMMREKLADAIKEFDAILKPGGKIKFLGTPQTNDSIYNKLPARGYVTRIWPIRFPDAAQLKRYGDLLSPFIRNRTTPENAFQPTEPTRFPLEEIARQELSWGRSGFDLQFMLDTSLADANRFPLKLMNLIVMSLAADKGPDEVIWGRSDDLAYNNLPVLGFPGDKFYKPALASPTFSAWNSVKACIDPSDKGKDETALTIAAELHGRVFILEVAGWVDGSAPATMKAIAALLVKWRVQEVTVETNFGGTMFGQLLRPHVQAAWDEHNANAHPDLFGGTTILEERAARVQKELRIISDLEPATQSHRLVISTELVERDYSEVMARDEGDTKDRYSLFYQYCNLTRDRDCLTHDDRLDTLAGVVGLYRDKLGVNPRALAAQRAEDAMEAEIQRLFDDADDTTGNARDQLKETGRSHRHGRQDR